MKIKNKTKKTIKWILIVLMIITIVLGIIWTWVSSILPPDQEKMEKYFRRDKDDLNVVFDYLCSLEYSFVDIDKSDIKDEIMFTGPYTRYQNIEDQTALSSLKRLLGYKGYTYVQKYNDTIVFNKWCFSDREIGIAVSISGDYLPLAPQYIVETEHLSEENWYYYKSDYVAWREIQHNRW